MFNPALHSSIKENNLRLCLMVFVKRYGKNKSVRKTTHTKENTPASDRTLPVCASDATPASNQKLPTNDADSPPSSGCLSASAYSPDEPIMPSVTPSSPQKLPSSSKSPPSSGRRLSFLNEPIMPSVTQNADGKTCSATQNADGITYSLRMENLS